MKKIVSFLILLILSTNFALAIDEKVEVYQEKNKFGLIKGETKLTEAKYSKLVSLRDESYIFLYKNRYGIISKTGDILVEAKYTSASRFIGKFAKFGLGGKYVLYNEKGEKVIDDSYSDIAILFGGMFMVKKNYKYGLISFNGETLLPAIADDIYMPKANVIKILYDGVWYEITHKNKEELELPADIKLIEEDSDNFSIKKIVDKPVTSAGYGIVSTGDYLIKIFSSISPAYEETIDELVLSHGADTATILLKSSWLIKFPYVYAKNYINNFKAPNNGPMADVKANLKNKINN